MSDNRLTQSEYDSWEPLPAALKRVQEHLRNNAKEEIRARLYAGRLRSAARESRWEHENNTREDRTFEILSGSLWTKSQMLGDHESVWSTGSRTFIIPDRYHGDLGTECVGLRVDPNGILQILRDAGVSLPAATPSTSAPIAVQAKDKGGRPRAEWWDDLWVEVVRQARTGEIAAGTFKSAARLQIHLDEIYERQHPGFSPGDSTLKPMSLKSFKMLQENGGK